MGRRDKTNTKTKPEPDAKPAKTAEDDGFVCIYRPTFDLAVSFRAREGDPDALCEMGRLYFEGRDEARSTRRHGEGGKSIFSSRHTLLKP